MVRTCRVFRSIRTVNKRSYSWKCYWLSDHKTAETVRYFRDCAVLVVHRKGARLSVHNWCSILNMLT